MGVLALSLLVPLSMVRAIVGERATRRDGIVREVSATWGAPQTFGGAVLCVPYTVTWAGTDGRPHRAGGSACLLPKDLQIEGVIATEPRRRGMFDVIVYRAGLKVRGRFVKPSLDWVRPQPTHVDWDQATVSIGLSDPRGLSRRAALQWSGQSIPLAGGVKDAGLFSAGVHAPASGLGAVAPGAEIPFAFVLDVNGTRDIRFLPASEDTTVAVTSPWRHPSFIGAPLPEARTTGHDGFTAQWRVTDFGRSYRSHWTTGEIDRPQLISRADASAFGVSLVQPVDIYQQAERAVKYAVLFLVLTFLVFFLWEIFHAALLHPMQYAFVGFALCLFYLLLVSISEHAGFDIAYAASAAAATLLIGGYSRAVLRGNRQAASVVGSLAGLYAFLYLLLRLEDYALISGSTGMFVVLAFVMYVTRRMDWYSLRLGAQQ
jgi:inner membrane protein